VTDLRAPEHRAGVRPAPHIDETTTGYDTVLVLDFGAQYGQLIARRVRECHVYSQLIPFDTPLDEIRARRPRGLILSGGPMSVYVDDAPRPDPALFELGIPVPAFSTALEFFDGYRSSRLPANLLQAQRDYFGAHTYERVDQPRGQFSHTNWTGKGGTTASSTYTV